MAAACTIKLWLLVAPRNTFPLAVSDPVAKMGAEKVDTARTVKLFAPFVPNWTLPKADRVLPLVTVTAALEVIGADAPKVVTALTVKVWLPLAPRTTLPLAVKLEPTVMAAVLLKAATALTVRVWLLLAPSTTLAFAVSGALAVMGAEAAKVVAAFTVRVWLPLAPKTMFPEAVRGPLAVTAAAEAKVVTALTVRVWEAEVPSTVLPDAVRVEVGLARVTPPEKVARPELSRVRRSTGCPLLLLVLNTRLPPVLPVASCKTHCSYLMAESRKVFTVAFRHDMLAVHEDGVQAWDKSVLASCTMKLLADKQIGHLTVSTEHIWAASACTDPSYPLNAMLPSTKPLVTAALPFCRWKPSTAPLL